MIEDNNFARWGRMRILILRLSSFGDIVQAMATVNSILEKEKDAQITWVTKAEFSSLLHLHPRIDTVVSFNKADGFRGWLKLSLKLAEEDFDYFYDAHMSTRSRFTRWIFKWKSPKTIIVTRSKERFKRFLLFKFHINKFEWPYRGILSYLKPLLAINLAKEVTLNKNWNFSDELPKLPEHFDPKTSSHLITLSPSAAWEMKRWPLPYWKKLIEILPEYKFLVLAGPKDDFCSQLEAVAPERVLSLHGKVSLKETFQLIVNSHLLISADTGSLHVADLAGVKAIALLGPTAFGFTTNTNVSILQSNLPCRPCTKDGRGRCSRLIYQECMIEISPLDVMTEVRKIFQLLS